jgi:hypothetical protein
MYSNIQTIVLFLMTGLSSALSQNLTTEQQVIEMDKKLNAFITTHNNTRAATIYTDDFLLITSSGKFKYKQDMLREIASEALQLEINQTNDVKVRVHDNTAVLTGVLHQKGVYNNNAFDVKLYVTDTWIHTSHGWKLLSGHASIILQ